MAQPEGFYEPEIELVIALQHALAILRQHGAAIIEPTASAAAEWIEAVRDIQRLR